MSETARRPRFAPTPTPETQHFWEGTRNHELLLQRCVDCGTVYFPPRPFCPTNGSRNVEVVKASGRATLASYMINHRQHPSFDGHYAIALVRLEEGPMMMSNIVDCEQTPEALKLDMPLEVVFEKVNDVITVPLFRPVGATS